MRTRIGVSNNAIVPATKRASSCRYFRQDDRPEAAEQELWPLARAAGVNGSRKWRSFGNRKLLTLRVRSYLQARCWWLRGLAELWVTGSAQRPPRVWRRQPGYPRRAARSVAASLPAGGHDAALLRRPLQFDQ